MMGYMELKRHKSGGYIFLGYVYFDEIWNVRISETNQKNKYENVGDRMEDYV